MTEDEIQPLDFLDDQFSQRKVQSTQIRDSFPYSLSEVISLCKDVFQESKNWKLKCHIHPDIDVVDGKFPVTFKESFTEYFLDTKDFSLMKNNIWLKEVCFDGKTHFSLKKNPKRSDCYLMYEEIVSEDLNILLGKSEIEYGIPVLGRVICIPIRRYDVEGIFHLDISKLGEELYFFSMGFSMEYNSIGEDEMRLRAGKVKSIYQGYISPERSSSSKVVMFLFLNEKDLFQELFQKLGLECPSEETQKFVLSAVDHTLFPDKEVKLDQDQNDFLEDIGIFKYNESDLFDYIDV
jgi:hypothetical protein